jgi:hypothetical protein
MDALVKLSLGALLIGAIAGEWKATTDVMKRSKDAIARCTNAETTNCDLVGSASNLAAYSQDQSSILWRRSLIVSVGLLVALKPILSISLTSQQSLVFILLCWVAFTSISSYNDYHLRRVSAIGVQDCLMIAVNKADDACDPSLVNSVAMERVEKLKN